MTFLTYPFISCAAVKYAAIAWSCSLSTANECPYAIHAGPYVLSSVVALLKTKAHHKHTYLEIKFHLLQMITYMGTL